MKVKILQWNIWYKEDIYNIVKQLKKINADVICLQELTINDPGQTVADTPSFIAEQLDINYYHQEIIFDNKKSKQGNGIFSRFKITNEKSVWINEPNGTGRYDDENRVYIQTSLDVNGKTLDVGTVHMSYTQAFEPTKRKLKETDKLIKAIKNNKSSFVLTGDFNAQPGSEVLKKIESILNNAGPDDNQKTWTTKPFSYGGFEAATLDWRLDYIFATPEIKVISSEIIKTEFSDHLPILVTIEF